MSGAVQLFLPRERYTADLTQFASGGSGHAEKFRAVGIRKSRAEPLDGRRPDRGRTLATLKTARASACRRAIHARGAIPAGGVCHPSGDAFIRRDDCQWFSESVAG
jgi:hypothetical protein